jgi:hypothetical protein
VSNVTNTSTSTSNVTKPIRKVKVIKKKAPIVFNHSGTVVDIIDDTQAVLEEERIIVKKVMEIKQRLHKMNAHGHNNTIPDVKMMHSMVDVSKQADASLHRVENLLEQQKHALETTPPSEVEKIAVLEKAIASSIIEVKRAKTSSTLIARYVQDSAQAAVLQAKVEVENAVMETKRLQLGVGETKRVPKL